MLRPDASEHPAYYEGYLALVPEEDVLDALEKGLAETLGLLAVVGEARGGHRYAPGKWSIKELVGHLADCERIFGYRAMSMARRETKQLPSMDEDAYVAAADFDRRALSDLCIELAHLRLANLALFRGFTEEEWGRKGSTDAGVFTVRAFPFILAGHERHHREVLRGLYL
jgi:hypothetical protein